MTRKKNKSESQIGRSNLVIGLTGPFGSGCGEMRKVLETLDFHPFKISDDIRKELKGKNKLVEKGKPNWRKVLQDHGNEKRQNHHQDYWIKRLWTELIRSKLEMVRL